MLEEKLPNIPTPAQLYRHLVHSLEKQWLVKDFFETVLLPFWSMAIKDRACFQHLICSIPLPFPTDLNSYTQTSCFNHNLLPYKGTPGLKSLSPTSSSGLQKHTWFWRSVLSLPYTASAEISVLQAKLCPWGSLGSPVAFCRLHSCQATTYRTLLKIREEKENSMILTYFSSWSQRIWL